MVRYNVKQIDYAIIDAIKPLAMKLLERLGDRIAEPQRGNIPLNPNTLALIELRDWFFGHFNLPTREKALRALFNLVIIHHVFDSPYRFWIDILVDELKKKPWVMPEQRYFWKEDADGSTQQSH